jgi:3-deoxy-manno-octulosonate cytidylyltransferase (CMP-KDO synthetase)
MKIIGVIPARYASTRFPGKPLADIHGKPMIWWVYKRFKAVKGIDEVYIALDDKRIENVCHELGMKYLMTSDNLPEHISRVHEVSEKIHADYYICVNGDEPLISEVCIEPVLPKKIHDEVYFGGAMRILTNPAEVIDAAKIKIVFSTTGRCLYLSRTPVPYPYGNLSFSYHKYVGVECFNKKALDFFVSTPMGNIEKIEDIDHLRFLENNINLNFVYVDSESISVDTPKDLEYVRGIMSERIAKGEIIT